MIAIFTVLLICTVTLRRNESMREEKVFRTKVSQGYQVAVPVELRKRYGVHVGDEVIWILEGNEVRTNFRRRPSLENIASIGRSRKKESAVELKKNIQRGGFD